MLMRAGRGGNFTVREDGKLTVFYNKKYYEIASIYERDEGIFLRLKKHECRGTGTG